MAPTWLRSNHRAEQSDSRVRSYIARRVLLFGPTLLVASMAIFLMMRIVPGDVAQVILGGDGSDSSASGQLDALRKELGLTDPLPVQYGRWVWSMIDGEFGGRSIIDREPLGSIMARRWPVTFLLSLYAVVVSVVISVPVGVLAAVKQDRWPD